MFPVLDYRPDAVTAGRSGFPGGPVFLAVLIAAVILVAIIVLVALDAAGGSQ